MSRVLLSAVILTAIAAAQPVEPDQPLCRAALDGDVAMVRMLLARGSDPKVRDQEGLTPLMRVASAHERSSLDINRKILPDYVGVAKALLDKGAEVNARDPKGRTALLLAMGGSASEYRVIGADDSLAQLLIARGADVNAHDDAGWTPLLKVLDLWANQPALVEFLIAKGANVNARLNDGRSGLMLAARLGKDDRLPVLIAKGADVNARDEHGKTALMVAATVRWDEQSAKMMKLLIAKGANPNALDDQGNTAADLAAQAGYLERAQMLIASGTRIKNMAAFLQTARNHALLRAIESGDLIEATKLLDQGADPNFHEITTGHTLLMIAARDEYSGKKATLLLARGAAVNLRGADGDTALLVAAERYQPETVQALLDRGADPNAEDREGNTVLMRAAGSKYSWDEDKKALIPRLVAKGADVSRKNVHGVTALMLMAREGNPALPLLIEKGADPNARDDEGNTALLYAARFFTRQWPRRNGWFLLEHRADVNAANEKGETALILAATQFEGDAARLLLDKHANVNARTKTG
ncbi:MAG TPA: ankyrin repeat domain-containing protein, partial [Bryobacteraceae bacterium]